MRARPSADDRFLRASAFEEDRGRDREDAEARRSLDVLVDVQLREGDLALVLMLQLRKDGLDGAAGAAPGRPEVDDDGLARLEHVPLEARVGDLAHGYSLPVSASRRSAGTFQIASSTIAPLILEPPTSRSTNLIGTSTTRKPARSAR